MTGVQYGNNKSNNAAIKPIIITIPKINLIITIHYYSNLTITLHYYYNLIITIHLLF